MRPDFAGSAGMHDLTMDLYADARDAIAEAGDQPRKAHVWPAKGKTTQPMHMLLWSG